MSCLEIISIWHQSKYREQTCLIGENDFLQVVILPHRGGKIISFVNKATGKEWVYRADVPWKPLQYGMQWDDGDRSGWDDMFPTILACPCPDEPWKRMSYPDHGELWTLPWSYEIRENSVRLEVHGVAVPYLFSKTYVLNGKDLEIRYEVRNPTPFAISYLWCAHFLLTIEPGMKLNVDPSLDTVQYQYTHGGRMTPWPYGRSSYPVSGDVDLSVVEENLGRHAEKYWFEGLLQQGYTSVNDPRSGDSLHYVFEPEDVPYLAVWANYGTFNGDYTFAFEPSTGFLDDVYVAKLMGKVKQVQGYGTNRWDFVVSVNSCRRSRSN